MKPQGSAGASERLEPKGSPPHIDSSRRTKLLPAVLSVIAGSADVTSLLTLGLFNAHITGNLVLLAADVVTRGKAHTALILSVPVFIMVLALTRLLVAGFESLQVRSLAPLLLLQFLLLGGLFVLCGTSVHPLDRDAGRTLVAGQLGVAAMAVQGVMVQLSVKGAPPTAVMTTNVIHFIIDAGEILLGGHSPDVVKARSRAKHTWPVIIGFTAGAGLGAACFAAGGPKSLGVPAGLALLALVMGLRVKPGTAQDS
jgi:uncharacterized membrane protein YoaK (UPF0700 family)